MYRVVWLPIFLLPWAAVFERLRAQPAHKDVRELPRGAGVRVRERRRRRVPRPPSVVPLILSGDGFDGAAQFYLPPPVT
jgi:hypothetical protein